MSFGTSSSNLFLYFFWFLQVVFNQAVNVYFFFTLPLYFHLSTDRRPLQKTPLGKKIQSWSKELQMPVMKQLHIKATALIMNAPLFFLFAMRAEATVETMATFDWDADSDITQKCSTGKAIVMIDSIFSDADEERRWTFSCDFVGTGVANSYQLGTTRTGFAEANTLQSCSQGPDGPGAWAGFDSELDDGNRNQDRNWRTDCWDTTSDPSLGNFVDCKWTTFLNDFDGDFSNWEVRDTAVLTGSKTEFDNDYDDRRWSYRECDITCNKGYRRRGRLCNECLYPNYQDEDNSILEDCLEQPECGTGQSTLYPTGI